MMAIKMYKTIFAFYARFVFDPNDHLRRSPCCDGLRKNNLRIYASLLIIATRRKKTITTYCNAGICMLIIVVRIYINVELVKFVR